MATKEVDTALKQRIIPIGKRTNWLEARELTAENGGLPSNVLHDNVLVMSKDWTKYADYYGAWAREVLVYPKINGIFKKGKDVIDTNIDGKGRKWIFPASSVPEIAIGQKNVGLFVDPLYIEINDKRVVVLAEPKSVVVLTPFIQNWNEIGKVDMATRVPLHVNNDDRSYLRDKEQRDLWRIDGTGVKPIARGAFLPFRMRDIYANDDHSGKGGFGVAIVSNGKMLEGIQEKQLKALLRNAERQISSLSETVQPEKLEPLKKLVGTLRIG